MGADWSARRLAGLGACLAAGITALAPIPLAASAQQTGHAATAAPGCVHPSTATFKPGDDNKFDIGTAHIAIGVQTKRPWWVAWSVRAGYFVCSARIQLRDGSWVHPTRLRPYPTPTPSGGEYRESPGSHSRLRLISITAARSPVAAGSSCSYPLFSGQSLGGPTGDTKDFGVNVLQPGYHGDGNGLETTFKLQLEVTIHNPLIVICSAVLTVSMPNAEGFFRSNLYKEYPVAISPHGGLSPTIIGPVSQRDGPTAVAFARYR